MNRQEYLDTFRQITDEMYDLTAIKNQDYTADTWRRAGKQPPRQHRECSWHRWFRKSSRTGKTRTE